MRQDLLGKQEKTQRSIKRLVDFIKLIQLRKNESSPPSSASISCLPQPSSSRSARTISPPQTSTNQKTANSPRSSIPNTDKTPYIATITSSIATHDRASPISKKTKYPTPTNCPIPLSSQKSINHISSSKKSPNRLEGPISLLAVKPKTKTVPQFSTTNCRPVAALPFKPASNPSSPIPCSTIVTTVRSKPIVQSHSMSPYQNCQILFTPSRATISWTEQHSTAGSPGPNSHAANSVSISQTDQPQKSYCLLTATPRVTSSNGQNQPDQRRKQQRRISTVIANTDHETSSTHCSQAITSPIPSPVVHVSHEVSAQTTETVRSCDNSSVAKNTNWSCTSSQTTSQQQSSSSGALSRGSSST